MAVPMLSAGQSQVAKPLGMATPVKSLFGGNHDPIRTQQNFKSALQQLQSFPLFSAKMVTIAIPPNATSITLHHGLGTVPDAAIVIRSPNVVFLTFIGGEKDPTMNLNLGVSAGGFTCTILVF